MVACFPSAEIPVPSLTLKDIPAPLLERLRRRAAHDQRSLNREAIWLLEQALAQSVDSATQAMQQREAQLAAWHTLAGRWQGSPEETDALVETIYQSRTQGRDVVL